MLILLDKSEMAAFKMFTVGGISRVAAVIHIAENSEVSYESLEDYTDGEEEEEIEQEIQA